MQRANLRSDFEVRSGWCTPRMVTRLARLVHNRQSAAAGEDKRHSETITSDVFMAKLACLSPHEPGTS
jgi:hypothetical protein